MPLEYKEVRKGFSGKRDEKEDASQWKGERMVVGNDRQTALGGWHSEALSMSPLRRLGMYMDWLWVGPSLCWAVNWVEVKQSSSSSGILTWTPCQLPTWLSSLISALSKLNFISFLYVGHVPVLEVSSETHSGIWNILSWAVTLNTNVCQRPPHATQTRWHLSGDLKDGDNKICACVRKGILSKRTSKCKRPSIKCVQALLLFGPD